MCPAEMQQIIRCLNGRPLSVMFTVPIIFSAIVGNILVIIAIFIHRPLRCVQNYFIVSLAVTDLLVGFLVVQVSVLEILKIRWKLGTVLCRILVLCIATCSSASILNLCAIALDRYWAVANPIAYAQKRTLKHVVTIISLVWLLSITVCFPPILDWNEWTKSTGHGSCRFPRRKAFVLCASLLLFYFPLLILSFLYLRIYQIFKKRLKARIENTIEMSSLPERKRLSLQENRHDNKTCKTSLEQQEYSKTLDRETEPKSLIEQEHLKTFDQGTEPNTNVKQEHSETVDQGIEQTTPVQQAHLKIPYLQVPDATISQHLSPENSTLVSSQDSNQFEGQDKFVANILAEKQWSLLNREKRIIKTLTIIVGAFFICYAPFFLVNDINVFCQNCINLNDKMGNFIDWFAFWNSCLNPLIYTIFNRDFREAFKKILKC